jgi:2-keto-4-pentenoate hydratase
LSDAKARETASLLATTYLNNNLLESLPRELCPESLADGYAVQDYLIEELGFAPAGWKLGLTNAKAQAAKGVCEPVKGRLFKSRIATAPARLRAPPGKLMLEAEFVFRMACDLGGADTRGLSVDDVADAVASVHMGLELCASRFVTTKPPSLAMNVADNCFHGGLVIGGVIHRWKAIDLPAMAVELFCNDTMLASGSGSAVLGNPVNGLLWLAKELAQEGRCLAAGDWVTTGSCTGAPEISAGVEAREVFGGMGEVRVCLDRDTPWPSEVWDSNDV